LNSIGSCASSITYVDGEAGNCLYRGYPVHELVHEHDYLDISYLLLYGNLPILSAKKAFRKQVSEEMLVHNRIKEFIMTFVPGAHPMSILASVAAAMASFYADPMAPAHIENWEMRELACIRLLAKMPTIVAMIYKNLIGEPMVYPRHDLSYAQNFLNMMFSSPTKPYEIDPLQVKIIDTFLSIHADHEQNASTSTVRTAGSSLANPYACIATGITSLWGRSHGGANEAAIEALKSIGSVENVPEFVERVKRKEARLMGFGHRVYKNYDPRAKIMQKLCHLLFENSKSVDPLFEVAQALEKVAMNDEYFTSRKLFPNVDFYSGILLRSLGIPQDMFTVMFAMGRTVGWLSHWKEMLEEGLMKIVRPRQLYLGSQERTLKDNKPESEQKESPYDNCEKQHIPFHIVHAELLRTQPSFLQGHRFAQFGSCDKMLTEIASQGLKVPPNSNVSNKDEDGRCRTPERVIQRNLSSDSPCSRKGDQYVPQQFDCRSPERLGRADSLKP